MSSIISFSNVRMSGVKSPVMSYAALGVGLAIVLTVGLSAITGVVEQPFMAAQQRSEEQAAIKLAPAPEMAQRQEDVSPEAGSEAMPSAPMFAEKSPAEQEKFYMTTEQPYNPLAGLSMAIPYIAAAVAGSVVFVITRKRIGL